MENYKAKVKQMEAGVWYHKSNMLVEILIYVIRRKYDNLSDQVRDEHY